MCWYIYSSWPKYCPCAKNNNLAIFFPLIRGPLSSFPCKHPLVQWMAPDIAHLVAQARIMKGSLTSFLHYFLQLVSPAAFLESCILAVNPLLWGASSFVWIVEMPPNSPLVPILTSL